MGSTTPTFTPIDPNVTEGIPDGDPRLAELEPGQRLRLLAHQPFPQTPRGLQAPDLLLGLFQEFMGTPQAEFRSAEQRECLYHLLKPTPFLLMALPTAGGKTTLFLLAASLAWAHTTVLVVPLVSLKLNLQSKLQNLGLPWVNWEDQHEETPPTRLVLVSIESAVSQVFINWAMQLYHQNALDRIIFDEAHLIPLARSYRGVMNDVNRLSQIPVPKVFASATMTQPALDQLRHQFLLPAHLPLVVRGRADPPRGQVIIYLPYKGMVEEFHQAYPQETAYFHASMPEEDKTRQVESFDQGQKLVLLGTAAIGEGYDFAHTAMVIHWGTRWGISQFLQATGRAARGAGEIGWSYAIIPP
ncbi:hypothetical protein MAP00_009255 [Monascus purpureus]|nr:hypothetical protein MAP00_009255 [Monascus purpureus]